MAGSDGTEADFDGLRQVASRLNNAGDHLDGASGSAPRSVDAGPSTGVLSSALSEAMRGAASIATAAASTGGKVHASSGSYGDTENTAASGFH